MPAASVQWLNPITETHDNMTTGFVFPYSHYQQHGRGHHELRLA
jgi:hypothetical protein